MQRAQRGRRRLWHCRGWGCLHWEVRTPKGLEPIERLALQGHRVGHSKGVTHKQGDGVAADLHLCVEATSRGPRGAGRARRRCGLQGGHRPTLQAALILSNLPPILLFHAHILHLAVQVDQAQLLMTRRSRRWRMGVRKPAAACLGGMGCGSGVWQRSVACSWSAWSRASSGVELGASCWHGGSHLPWCLGRATSGSCGAGWHGGGVGAAGSGVELGAQARLPLTHAVPCRSTSVEGGAGRRYSISGGTPAVAAVAPAAKAARVALHGQRDAQLMG
mmetsp:Transcript_22413/g.61913  ORF Transcript_22413/g.61913 Transcript_22413/m.61913 type:complete len:276 (+) Transcript_22413:832-1659(+)